MTSFKSIQADLNRELTDLFTKYPQESMSFVRIFRLIGALEDSEGGLKVEDIFVRAKRKTFPKTFKIESSGSLDRLVEIVDEGDTIFCTGEVYDVIVDTIQEMFKKDSNASFDRFELFNAVQKHCPQIKLPAILACMHLWMSLENPLIEKDNMQKMRITTGSEDFERMAHDAWDEVNINPLRLEKPRYLIESI
jgi:hypothetical protein